MKILVTGASGFIGRLLCTRLVSAGWRVRGTLLEGESAASLAEGVEPVVVEPLGPTTSWEQPLQGIEMVIHLAARVHVMADQASDPLAEYRLVNTEGTTRLAREAAKAGVKRLLFISSIKVNGEESPLPYTETSPAGPTDPYGVSKWEAEQSLRRTEAETGLQVVILRPTLVYGPGVRANFLAMLRVVHRGLPLPLASIRNRRSLLYTGNLVDALAACAAHPAASGRTFLLSDGEDVSTPELIRRTASALKVPARLLPFPPALMRLAGVVARKSAAVDRLTGSLTVDSSCIRRELGWKPPFTMEEGLRVTAEWFIKEA